MWGSFALLGILILFILMEALIPNQTINVFQVRSYIANYDTMEPTIKPNDVVFVSKINVASLEQGDMVTFTADINYDGDTEMVTYYVDELVERNDGKYNIVVIQEGATTPFGTISYERIHGGYAFRIPYLGAVLNFMKSPLGIATIAVNVLVIIGIVVLVKKPTENKKNSVQEKK